MATARSLFFLGIVFISHSMIGASPAMTPATTPATTEATAIFDVKSFGAVADDKTDNVLVS
jgi:hypothetical protein